MSELFKNCPNTVSVGPATDGIVFRWSRKGIGFGELTLRASNGKLYVDSEGMTDEFCLGVIKQAFEGRDSFLYRKG